MLDDPQQDLDGSLERSATTWDDVMADDDEDTNEVIKYSCVFWGFSTEYNHLISPRARLHTRRLTYV